MTMITPLEPCKINGEPVAFSTPALMTLEQLAKRAADCPDLSATQKRDIGTGIRSAGRACQVHHMLLLQEGKIPPGTPCVPFADCAYLNEHLLSRSPRVLGFNDDRFSNVLSALRFAMRRFDLHARKQNLDNGASPAWCALLERSSAFGQLTGFAIFATRHGIEPNEVSGADLSAFREWRLENTLSRGADEADRYVGQWWRSMERRDPTWPRLRGEVPRKRRTYAPPVSSWPDSLREDMEAFLRRLACTDPDEVFPIDCDQPGSTGHSRPKRRARETTLETRRAQIGMAIGALVANGRALETINTLRDLVEPLQTARAILTYFHDKSKGQPSSNSAGIAEVLRQIAKFHCGLPAPQVAQIAKWTAVARGARRLTMTPKNNHRLRRIFDPNTLPRFLHAPQQLMKEAREVGHRGKAIRMARTAIALEILLAVPMRVRSLRHIRLNEQLLTDKPGSNRYTRIHVSGTETKNGVPIDWELPASATALIAHYLKDFRTASEANPYLFPGTGDKPIFKTTLCHYFTITLSKFIGVEINPHLMRHFAALMFLQSNPGAYEMASRILGHRNVSTTQAFYCGMETEAATKAQDKSMKNWRDKTRPAAAASFRKRPTVKRGEN